MIASNRLQRIAASLIELVIRNPDTTKATHELCSLMLTITRLDIEDRQSREPTMLSGGRRCWPRLGCSLCDGDVGQEEVRSWSVSSREFGLKNNLPKTAEDALRGVGTFAFLALPITSLL